MFFESYFFESYESYWLGFVNEKIKHWLIKHQENHYIAPANINSTSAYKKRIRSKGGILQILILFGVEPDGRARWYIDTGIKMSQQNTVLLQETGALGYFNKILLKS